MKTITYKGAKFRVGNHGYYVGVVNGKTTLLHRLIYEEAHGKVPSGHEVHHKNGNKTDNRLENLEMLSSVEHGRHTFASMTDEWKEQSKRNLLECALPKASEWHGSKEGLKWHKKHYHESLAKAHEIVDLKCEYCGASFRAEKKTRFCSASCHMKYTRERCRVKAKCEVCGKEFDYYKYEPHVPRTCSRKCAQELKKRTWKDKARKVKCVVCGVKFPLAYNGRLAICSECCYTRWTRDKSKYANPLVKMPVKTP